LRHAAAFGGVALFAEEAERLTTSVGIFEPSEKILALHSLLR